jgi:methionyl-tRNA formyltransferase
VRIAFFGLPLAALLLDADGHDIVHAAICRSGAIGTRRLQKRLGGDRVTIKPLVHARRFLETLRALEPDLVVSWFWTTKLPPALLTLAPLGAIGVHPSLLPRHRGPDPYFWALRSGDAITGVTAHRLAEEYDTGAILGVRTLTIDPSWDAWALARKLDRPSLALLRETVDAFARGERVEERPQEESLATQAPAPDDDALEIRWDASTDDILRLIRAAAPWPGAFTAFGDEVVVVTRARRAERFPRALAPGEAAIVGSSGSEGGDVVVLRTGDGAIELLDGRLELVDDADEDEDAPHGERTATESDGVPLDRAAFVERVRALS